MKYFYFNIPWSYINHKLITHFNCQCINLFLYIFIDLFLVRLLDSLASSRKIKEPFFFFFLFLYRWRRPTSEHTQTGSGATRTAGNPCQTAEGCRRSSGRGACPRALVRIISTLAHPTRQTKTALACRTLCISSHHFLFGQFTSCHDCSKLSHNFRRIVWT